jgi:peptide deformylase
MVSNPRKTFLIGADIAHLITWFGDPVLRSKCSAIPVDEIDHPEIMELSATLTSTLQQIRQQVGIGRGLAAPQIGVLKRMFVVFHDDQYQVLINPRVTWSSEEQGLYIEMCLSGYPLAAEKIRPWSVEIEYYNIHGTVQRLSPDPMLSRIIQHELDHLDGVLFIDDVKPHTMRIVSDLDNFMVETKLVRVHHM